MPAEDVKQSTRTALEFGPLLLFLAAYILVKDRTFTVGGVEYTGFIAVTAGFIPILLLSIGILWRLTGKLSRMQTVTAVLVVAFGGLTIWFNDERFFKIKPTIIYLLFAGVLAVGLLRGKSVVQYLLSEALPLEEREWFVLTRNCAILFFALAVANELVWRNLSTESWVYFKTLVAPIVTSVILFVQVYVLMAGKDQDDPKPEPKVSKTDAGGDA